MSRVVNITGRKKGQTIQPGEVYISRANHWLGLPGSKWANPFKIGKHGTRDECVAAYETHIRSRPDLCEALDELRGKDLACWCAPAPCHGDVLLRMLEEES